MAHKAPAIDPLASTSGIKIDTVYKLTRTLGQGSFATVKLGSNIETKELFAVKIIKRAALKPKDIEVLKNEISIMHTLSHPHIVGLKEVYDTSTHVYLVMELMKGGELFDRIVQKDRYSEREAKEAMYQIVIAIDHCHSHGIIHRDIKAENLLYSTDDANAVLKLADFGLASIIHDKEMLHAACGTPGYVAPEVVAEISKKKNEDTTGYGKPVDMWSIGVVMYILLCGFPPFYDDDSTELFRLIEECNLEFPCPYFDEISNDAKKLISNLIVKDPSKRYTTKQVLEDKWFTQDVSSVQLTYFKENIKHFNARRRMRGAIKAVQMINKLKQSGKGDEVGV